MLTVVVPTVPGRESLLSRCLWSVTQHPVDILVIEGTGQLGDKMNAAYAAVKTPYVAACDDDDELMADYDSVLKCLGMVDYVGFKFLELCDGGFHNISACKADYPHWGIRTRPPSPKCPIRSDIARKVKFANDYKADRRWALAARDHISTWDFIDRPLYRHDWWTTHSTFYGAKPRDVGRWPFDESRIQRMTVDA